jgi:hypothetical protein
MDNHTPGPWTWKYGKGGYELKIMGANGSIVVAGCGCCGSPFGHNLEYDARLLAASPDLLEALEALLDVQEAPREHILLGDWQRAMDAARAAIKKARGE